MELVVFTIITVVFIVAIFFAWFFRQQARNKERLVLIEKGENLDQLLERKERRFSFPWLKLGVLILGLSIGLGVITLVEFITNSSRLMNGPFPLFIMGLFGGISMIIAHYVEKHQGKK